MTSELPAPKFVVYNLKRKGWNTVDALPEQVAFQYPRFLSYNSLVDCLPSVTMNALILLLVLPTLGLALCNPRNLTKLSRLVTGYLRFKSDFNLHQPWD